MFKTEMRILGRKTISMALSAEIVDGETRRTTNSRRRCY